ncbi:MAG TPA: alpha/beta hydrolase [Chitinophagaceae bacterium]|nr:alpha/beta hydrolase [Chitinophagaceae bacterium]
MEKKLLFQGKNLWYRLRGEGQPVMLVHGFGEDHRIWDEQVIQLEKRFRVILPDLPGSGDSELAPDVSMDNMAEALYVILQEEEIDSIALFGHSMGGYVALAFAEKYPNVVSALGLVHSTAYADNEEKKATRRKGIEFIRNHGVHEFLKGIVPNLFSAATKQAYPELVTRLIDRYRNMDSYALIAYYEAMMQRPDRTEVLKNFKRPVLFMAGEQDTVIPHDHVVQQSGLTLLSHLHVLHRSGHMGMWEEPNECGFILEDFIKNNVL